MKYLLIILLFPISCYSQFVATIVGGGDGDGIAYNTPSIWHSDTTNRFYAVGIPSFEGDIYFNEDGSVTWGNEVANADVVINGNIYDYYNDGGTLYVNYQWANESNKSMSGDTLRPVDDHGALNVSGRFLRNSDNDAIILRGVGIERTNWFGDFFNDSLVWYGRDKLGIEVYRPTLGVEIDKNTPENDMYYADSVTNIAQMEIIVDAAIKRGVYVVINWHEFIPNQLGSAIYFFQYMATKYGEYPNVIYEIFNEPRNYEPYNYTWTADIKPYAEVLIDSIRSKDADNIILIGNPNYNTGLDTVALNPITGETNIMYTLHFYAYADDAAERLTHTNAIISGNLPVFMTEGAAMNSDGDSPFDYDEWEDWDDWLDTMKISSSWWVLTDKDGVACHMLTPENFVDTAGWWDEGDDYKQWGRDVRLKLRAHRLTDHVTIKVPEGVTTVWNNIVAAYNFNEASGDLLDLVGSADGTLSGPTQGVTSKSGFNDCYTFDGGNDSIGFGQAVFNSQTFTISAWVKVDVAAAHRAVIGWKTNGGPEFRVSDNDYLALLEQNISIIISSGYVSEDVWKHIVVSYNTAGDYALYVDGELEASGTNDKTLVFSSMTIGAQPVGEWFAGEMDNLYIWDVVKTSSHISELYNSGAGLLYGE